MPGNLIGRRQRREQPFGKLARVPDADGVGGIVLEAGVFGTAAALHHGKFVAAQPCDGVALAHAGAHPACHRTQHIVAGRVAERVVDGLEAV